MRSGCYRAVLVAHHPQLLGRTVDFSSHLARRLDEAFADNVRAALDGWALGNSVPAGDFLGSVVVRVLAATSPGLMMLLIQVDPQAQISFSCEN